MFNGVVTDTNIVMYLMIAVGVIGVLAKVMNQITLRRMVKAAGNMSKSTHKLMKLVRAKFEHVCMAYDKVENVDAFVEKHIYEYREILFRIHTWRQIEIQTIWLVGLLSLFGAWEQFITYGMGDGIFQYLVTGGVEMALLFVIAQLTDKKYQMDVIENYMIEYLENVCAHKYHKVRTRTKDEIDVIPMDVVAVSQTIGKREEKMLKSDEIRSNTEETDRKSEQTILQEDALSEEKEAVEATESILKEDTIRQILEEFLI